MFRLTFIVQVLFCIMVTAAIVALLSSLAYLRDSLVAVPHVAPIYTVEVSTLMPTVDMR